MLIEKGGISREIDENRLSSYKSKGYEAVEEKPQELKDDEKPQDQKPPKK
jgi:hypothetical protein